jgi:D-alanyl-D-alanine endopeptidase (penicillin-binding protein 7)
MAMLASPPLAAAPGKQRVKAHHAPRLTIKAPARKYVPRASYKVEFGADGLPLFKSTAVMVVDLDDGKTIYAKNPRNVAPIASITKLMTAMVVLDADLPLDEMVYIDTADFDFLKHTHSRLELGTGLPRREMLRLALMSSENRAAASLARSYPGGTAAFTAAMNQKAVQLHMNNSHFVDSTGLSSDNVSTAQDLVKMVKAAYSYPLIREFTTTSAHAIETMTGRNLQYGNTNGLVRNPTWDIGLSKTGYISQAGRCLVMQAKIAARAVVIVLLDASDKYTRAADANLIKKWLESALYRKPDLG